MNSFGKVLKVVAVIAGIIALGVLIGWYGSRTTAVPPVVQDPAPASSSATEPSAGSTGPVVTTIPPTNRIRSGPRPRLPGESEFSQAAYASGNIITNWEDRIDDILGGEGEDANKAKEMLQMFPNLPQDAQVEVAQHISNLTADEDYGPLSQYATNTALAEEVLEILLDDALNRPNAVKLPLLLDIAKSEQHPKAEDARELLELFLEEDYGNDWAKWQTKMQQWLQENPD